MAAQLLNAGFDFKAPDLDKEAALFWVAENGVKGAVQLLVNKKVDIEAEDKDGRTALHYAGEYGQSDIADLLLKEGASVDTRTNEGQTALILAARYLKVKGRKFSRIDVVLDFAADLLGVAKTPDEIDPQIKLKGFPNDSKYPTSDDNYLDAVCETIIADLNLTNQEKESITYSKNKSIVDYLELRKEFDGAFNSRRLVLTANGFVGLGPADAAVGDIICLLFGGSVMYAIRQEILGVGDHRFIGECYLHGVINGEAVSMSQENHDLYYTFY